MIRQRASDTVVILIFTLLTLGLMGPVVRHFNFWLYGTGHDAIATVGGIAERLQAHGGNPPQLLGAPFFPVDAGAAAAPVWLGTAELLARILSPVGAANGMIFIGLVGTAIAVYALLRWRGIPIAAAALGALIYGFCPMRLAEAQQHIGYLDEFWFVIEGALLLKLWDRMESRWAIGLGACIALTELDNPYLGYFAGILAGCWYLLLAARAIRGRCWPKLGRIFAVGLLTLAAMTAIVVPAQYALLFQASGQTGGAGSTLVRSLSDLERLSLRWWNFLLPFPLNPLVGPLGRGAFYRRLGIDTVNDNSEMIGYTALLLAAFGVGSWLWTGRKGAIRAQQDPARNPGAAVGISTSKPQALFSLGLTAIIGGIVFGLPPVLNLGWMRVFTPPYLAYHLFPEIRYTSRIDLIIQLGIAILAALGAARLLGLPAVARWRNAVAAVLAILVLVEYVDVPPWDNVPLLPAPPLYAWLATLSSTQAGIVAQYPMTLSYLPPSPTYMFYAYVVHHHPLFNGTLEGTPPDALRRNLEDVLNPTFPSAWAALGVKTVTMATGYFEDLYGHAGLRWDGSGGAMIDLLPSGYHLAFNSQGEQGYHVTAPPAPLVVGLPESVGDADLRQDGRLWQRIGNDNTLWMDNVTTQPVQAVIWTQAHNNTGPHVISWPGYAAVPVSLVQDAWPVAVVVDAPPGLHALPLHVAGVAPPMPGTGNPTPVTVELRSLEPAPIHPLQAQFVQGGETRWVLFGVSADACTIQAGATLDVALLWRVYVPTLTNQTVFVHLVGPDGKLAAQADGPPDAGSVATSMTLATPDVSDAHAVTLPKTLAPGTYQLQAGLYDPTTMVRMPLATSGDTVSLGQINVVPPNDGSRRIPCS